MPSDPLRRRQLVEAITVMRQVWKGTTEGFDGDHYQLGAARGFPRPEPSPPIVVGAFGPKMAALAGQVGDGINLQAFHPRIEDLLGIARLTREEAGLDASDFLVTAFAGLDQPWLDQGSAERLRLRRLEVDRLILVVDPPYDPDEIRAAGRLMARSRR